MGRHVFGPTANPRSLSAPGSVDDPFVEPGNMGWLDEAGRETLVSSLYSVVSRARSGCFKQHVLTGL
jgi:hypothetical protein